MFEFVSEVGVLLIFDIDYCLYSWVLVEDVVDIYLCVVVVCDIIIGNDVEFGFLVGVYDKGFEMVCDFVCNDGKIIVYKMGEKGFVMIMLDVEFKFGIYWFEVFKFIGVGDSFMGGFVVVLVVSCLLEMVVLCGFVFVVMVVSWVGCVLVMLMFEELDVFLFGYFGFIFV